LALVLADLFPEKHDDILAIGHSLGWHCVEIARHYPTDIYAERVFAQAIVREMKDNPDFQRDLAEVKVKSKRRNIQRKLQRPPCNQSSRELISRPGHHRREAQPASRDS
jgi:hypothetical protein